MEEVVEIDGIKYRKLAQFRDTSKMEECIKECRRENCNFFIVEQSDMWIILDINNI